MAHLRILFVEDDPLDVELAVRELRRNGYDPEWQRVDTQAEFTNRLMQDPPDIIISDHAMPQFSSFAALKCLSETELRIPFIVVSHAIGEEEAVGLMRDGAADYLIKDRMARLGEAVRHALDGQQLRSQYAEAQQDLRLLNQELERRIVERTAELEVANRSLASELSERKLVEERLRQLTSTLEERVSDRTRELTTSYARLRALATDLTVAEQKERRQLATELHDYLAQLLVVTRMKVGHVLKEDLDPEVGTVLREADELLHQSLNYTRSLVSELTPQALYERGLGPALHWLGDQMRRQKVLNVEIALDAPELALPEADSVLLFHSIRELLFNVFKHGQTDRASVSMRYAQDMLTITVSDHGCGFDVSRLRDDSSDRFGLLSIRERMTALGGSLDLQSELGKGTVASLQLPFTASVKIAEPQTVGREFIRTFSDTTPLRTIEPDSATPASAEAGLATPLRVMLVDDFDLVRKSLRSLLEQYSDVTVVGEASTGEQALQLACSLNPDVVVMDMHMPGWDGAETTRRLLKERPATVVIGLSIQTDADIAKSMLEAGAAAFIAKETAVSELYATLRSIAPRTIAPKSLSSLPHAYGKGGEANVNR